MSEFDACYFCGIAIDAPVVEYDVIPASFGDERGPIAALCPSCKGKLEKVIEPTVRRLDVPEGDVTLEPAGDGDTEQSRKEPTPATTPDTPQEGGPEIRDEQQTPGPDAFEEGIEVEPADREEGQPGTKSTAPDSPTSGDTDGSERDTDDLPERPDTETYNRVVRLLQNREFPVDRSEFETLASSAYDVSPTECKRVIEYAIDRGELDERDGELRKPE